MKETYYLLILSYNTNIFDFTKIVLKRRSLPILNNQLKLSKNILIRLWKNELIFFKHHYTTMQNRIHCWLLLQSLSCMHSAADSSSKMPHFCPNIDTFSFNKIPTKYYTHWNLEIWNEIKCNWIFRSIVFVWVYCVVFQLFSNKYCCKLNIVFPYCTAVSNKNY